MARAALVNMDTMIVENVGGVGSPTPVIQGKQFIFEKSWGPTPPAIGMIWNGDDPATFAAPPPPNDEDEPPRDLDEANTRIRAAREALDKALDEQAALLGQ